MKKKYFSPEMEEMEIENAVLLATSCGDETESGSETAGDKPVTDF